MPLLTKKRGGKIVIVNLQTTKQDKQAFLKINTYVDTVMIQLCSKLGLEIPEWTKPIIILESSHKVENNGKVPNIVVDHSLLPNQDGDSTRKTLDKDTKILRENDKLTELDTRLITKEDEDDVRLKKEVSETSLTSKRKDVRANESGNVFVDLTEHDNPVLDQISENEAKHIEEGISSNQYSIHTPVISDNFEAIVLYSDEEKDTHVRSEMGKSNSLHKDTDVSCEIKGECGIESQGLLDKANDLLFLKEEQKVTDTFTSKQNISDRCVENTISEPPSKIAKLSL